MSENVFGYVGKKIIEMVASLTVLAALTFFLLKVLPGGPFDDEVALNPIVKAKLIEHWNVESSWYSQGASYIQGLLSGDLGVSMARPDKSVSEIISQGFRQTFYLNALALLVVVIGSLFVSILASWVQRPWVKELIDQGIIVLLALPSLFWGPLLIYIFGFYFDLLPVAFLTSPAHYLLPLLTLSLRPMASLTRLLKNSMNDNLHFDYVRTARAKGITEWNILSKHVLRNSLIPFLSYLGPLLVSLISGSVLVEVLFAVPGLGTEFVSALNDRDYTLIMGLTLFYGVMLITANSIVDILLRIADPRLKGAQA